MTYGEFKKDAKKYAEAECLLSLWLRGKAPLYPLIKIWQDYKNKYGKRLIQLALF